MERYSLLKLSPSLLPLAKKPVRSVPANSLYQLLEGVADGRVKGVKVVAVDGASRREYVVEKYQRYKAGLLGRVWLKRREEDADEDALHSTDAKIIDDETALGLKWHFVGK